MFDFSLISPSPKAIHYSLYRHLHQGPFDSVDSLAKPLNPAGDEVPHNLPNLMRRMWPSDAECLGQLPTICDTAETHERLKGAFLV